MNTKLIKKIFEKHNVILHTAENGQQGIELLNKNTYDIILMDLQMPILNGFETTDIIINKMKLKLPIIAITANNNENEKRLCLSNGMASYLTKPFKQNVMFYRKGIKGEKSNITCLPLFFN